MPHIHEKIDFCSNVYIVNGDAVLLRMHDKHNIWLPPGGHIELDEDPVEAAVREAKEEVGLDVELVGDVAPSFEKQARELLTPRFLHRHRISDTHEHICFEYFARSTSRDFSQGETEVSEHIKWFTQDELNDPSFGITEEVQMHAMAALKALAT